MTNIKLFLSLLNICCILNTTAVAQFTFQEKMTSLNAERDLASSNSWKADNDMIKLRLEILELKQSQSFEEIKKKLVNFEGQFERLHRSLEKTPETVENIVTKFNGEEEPKLCIKAEDQTLVCSNITLPTGCSNSNLINCWNNKCRIQNRLHGSKSFLISCEDRMGESGWTTIQKRINNSIDFHRNWQEYKLGFGDLEGNYWIGLDKLYALTATWAPVELMIVLIDFNDVHKYAKYDAFSVGDESTKYFLKILGAYSGTAGDSLSSHKGHKFTTIDQDNDKSPSRNCAAGGRGGWWYGDCFASNLNGRYFETGNGPIHGHHDGIHWNAFRGIDYSLKSVEMLIRPKTV